jgi:dipeptidyl aminopeptidase/acylaminoacyl peptidase
LIFLALLAAGGKVPGVRAQRPFTLEQVMSAPFPTELVAAPTGGKVAWVFNDRGARNLWVAEPTSGGYKARPVTHYTDDDGQDLGDIAWTPDGKAIVFVRGGDLEFPERPYPNPRGFTEAVEQDVWVAPLAGGEPRKLGKGRSPAVSPKGDRVAFLFKDQVWLVKIDGSEKASQLIHSRGREENLRWSPDGAKLAFASSRGDHSFIAVYDFATRNLLYLSPSVDHDFSPVWSAEGKHVAFIRIPASKEWVIFGPKRAGPPWCIYVADATTGIGKEIWRAEDGPGSVFNGMVARDELLWTAGGRLVFPWERTGWLHLYSVPVEGGTAKLLTPGDFEVEDAALSPDRREIFFNSNQEDLDRRHIWKESVEGGAPEPVKHGAGIEWSPEVLSDGKTVAFLRSDARGPARPAILVDGNVKDLAPEAIPVDFPSASLVEPQQVIFSAADGMPIHGQLFLPASARDGTRHPAVIFFHGGSRRQMLLGWHYMGYYHNAYAMNQYLASRGSVVLSVNYRSGIGYGLNFREALNYGAAGASEFSDVMGAGLYLRSRPDVDTRHIGLWGGSYGGYLTALGLARASDLFAAGVDLHGVHDWNLEFPNWVPTYDPHKEPDRARLAFESSPLASVSTWRSPVLLIQGDDDRNVPFGEMVQLVEALRKQGVEFRQLVLPDEIHYFLLHASWLRAYHAASDFFDEHLKPSAAGR